MSASSGPESSSPTRRLVATEKKEGMNGGNGPESSTPSSSGTHSWRSPVTFSIRVDQNDQEVAFAGMLRPFMAEQMRAIRATLENAAKDAWGVLYLNFKRLKYMNNVAFLEITRFIRWVADERPDLKLKLIISSVIPWAIRKFQVISEIYPNVSVEVYDKSLYPIQQVIEDEEFIKVLRTQDNIIWHHERSILPRHGLRPGMKVADIACGLGDFAVRVHQEFSPERIVAVDHSKAFLKHAQLNARKLGLEVVEYQYGDAAALLLPDDSFDFVSCRLSIQVFHLPDQLMQELCRICKPGGRVYITNEILSCVTGYPEQELVRLGYQRYLELSRMAGMDFDIGVRTREILTDAHLEDIKGDLICIDNLNTNSYDFGKVVESWIKFCGDVAASVGADPRIHDEITIGLRAHVDAIINSKGYGTWPIFAGSGRKPLYKT